MSTVEGMSQLFRPLLCLALVGCGDNRETPTVDSPAPADSLTPDGPPAPVTVTARNRFTPAAGVRIVFLADDDAVIDNVVTDATGTASAMVPPSSKVVAMGPAGNTGHLWLGVEPGDQLSLDLGSTTTESTTVIVPTVANSTYNVETNCTDGFASSQTTTVTLDIAADCPVTDVVVYRQVIGNIVDALVVRNQTLTPGGTLDLSAMSYTAFVQGSVRVTGIPAGPTSVFLEGSRALGLEPILGRFADNLVPVAGAAEISGSLPDVPVAQVSLAHVRTQTATHILMRRGGSGPLVLDAVALPEVGAPAFATRTVSWVQGPSGQPVDGDLRATAPRAHRARGNTAPHTTSGRSNTPPPHAPPATPRHPRAAHGAPRSPRSRRPRPHPRVAARARARRRPARCSSRPRTAPP